MIITGRPRAATEPRLLPIKLTTSVGEQGSFSQGIRKNRAAPIPNFDQSTFTILQTRDGSPPNITHSPRPDPLVSSSLATSPHLGVSSLQQRQEELFNDGGVAEEIADSERPSWDNQLEMDPPSSSSSSTPSRAGRLLRRASGKFLDKKSKKEGRGELEFEGAGAGRSLTSSSSISLASIASTMSTRMTKHNPELNLQNRDHPPTSATSSAFRRARALSSASAKDAISLLPNYSRSFSRNTGASKEEAATAMEMPLTPPHTGIGLFGATLPLGQEESSISAPPSRWKKTTGKSTRPSTASGAVASHTPSFQTYLLRLSPPPRGMATHDTEGRKALVCHYVQKRKLEEMRNKGKPKPSLSGSLKMPLTPSMPSPSGVNMDSIIEWLEDSFHRFMEEEIRQGADVQLYKQLLLADVFIEARRSLGLESASTRLHAMFDLNETQTPHLFPVETMARGQETGPNTTVPANTTVILSPPPSAWEVSRRNLTDSLSPAPRKRRPKTAPNDARDAAPESNLRDEMECPAELPLMDGKAQETSSPSLTSSSRPSSLAFPRSSGSLEEAKDVQSQVLTPSLFSSKAMMNPSPKVDPSSLPPSPPRSSESHCPYRMAESLDQHRSLPPSHLSQQRPLSSSLAPRWSTESQTLTNNSCDATALTLNFSPTSEIMLASKQLPNIPTERGLLYTKSPVSS